MANKSILSKNYFIDPEEVSRFGAEVYNMMAEADQAMAEASEIIAEIASLTERVPSHIRCNELLEACASAQAEIKSVDFLSYGQKVDQGLQNLLDHKQYITEHFIKNMEVHTEKMRGLGEEFRKLTDSITYSGESMRPKGFKLSADGNAEAENTDGEEENSSVHGTEDMLCGGAAEVLEINTEEVMIESGAIILSNYMIAYGLGDDLEREQFINWISVRRPDLLQQLCAANLSSAEEAKQVLDEIFNEVAVAQNDWMEGLYDRYNLIITVEDVDDLRFEEDDGSLSSLNDVQKETFVKCWNMLVGMGLSLEQIIGVMANIYDEGRLSPTNAEDGGKISTENGVITLENGIIDDSDVYTYDCYDGIGYGICQWTFSGRKKRLSEMAEEMNGDVSDLDVQLAYLKSEMENWSEIDTMKQRYSLDDYLEVDNVTDAVEEFMKHFENPYLDGSKRIVFAQNIEDWYKNI